MTDNNIGLHLDLAIFNEHLHRGNIWMGSFGSNGARFDAMDPQHVEDAPFYVNSGANPSLMPPNPVPEVGVWFFPESGSTYKCDTTENACISGITPDLAPEETDVLVASGGILHPVLRWIAEKDLYRKIRKAPGFGASVYENFEDSRENGPVGKFYNLYKNMEIAFAADSIQQAIYRTNQDTIWVLLDSMAWVTTELLTETGVDSVALIARRDNLFERIPSTALTQDSLYSLILESRSLRADTLLVENAAISVQKLYESNEKSVTNIFLSTLMKGTNVFTGNQEKTLQAIASQCPWVGGDAVYTARSLYRLIKPKSVFDDDVLCGRDSIPQALQQEESLPEAQAEVQPQTVQIPLENIEVTVYPNPARDVIHVAFSSQPGGVVEARLLTLQGRSVYHRIFGAMGSNFSLSTEGLSAGMYFLQIYLADQVITTTRIAVIR